MSDGNFVIVQINRQKVRAMIDSGSPYTLCNTKFIDKLRAHSEPLQFGEINKLYTANGSQMNVIGRTTVDISLSGLIFPTKIMITEGLQDFLILGYDFLQMTGALILTTDRIQSVFAII